MRSTLFFIPNHIPGDPFGLPVFGLGWLLIVWLLASGGLAWWWSRREGSKLDLWTFVPYILVVAAGIVWVLPNLVEKFVEKEGLPIRSYGLLMVAAVLSGVLLAAYRAQRMGIDPEVIYSVAMLMTVSGIIGARLFFVIQYWEEFFVPGNPLATLKNLFNIPKGGLVVYGAVLGSFPVGAWYLWSRKLPPLVIADIVAPSMLLGLALGRVGCFMNGCCFGGYCSEMPPAVTFPKGSPPYMNQEQFGWRSGVWLKYESPYQEDRPAPPIVVAYVAPGSGAEQANVRVGDQVRGIGGKRVESLSEAQEQLAKSETAVEMEFAGGRKEWRVLPLPARSAPVHPAQLYAAIDAGLLALLLWVVYPFRRKDGEVTAIMFTLHPPSRFLLEIVRVDEGGQFGTGLTISQWVSIGLFLIGLMIWWYVERQPRGSAVPVKPGLPAPSPSAA